MSLYSELKHRNVFRVAIAYLAAGWLITEVSETLFPLFGYGDTPARIIVILLAIGFPLFLIFSWVFEITPEGLKLERDVIREESITPQTGKRIDRLVIVLLIAAVSYFAVDKFVLDPAQDKKMAETARQEGHTEAILESYGDKSIAVLPFVNMSDDPAQEYFSDGISEELLNLLSKIPEMRVIARTSSFSFKDKEVTTREIAKQLGVAHILEGSVRKSGSRVRITAQLIEARSDTHLWSDTYDHDLDDVFAIQDEIASAITRALKERLGIDIEPRTQRILTSNTEAHDAYLRGHYLVLQRTSASIETAVRELEYAISVEPEYALAHAELAIAISLQGRSVGYGDLTFAEMIARGTPHAELAMDLDPGLSEAYVAMGVMFHRQSKYEDALAHYERAIEIDPNNAIVHVWMGHLLIRVGRYARAIAEFEAALKLDPLSKVAFNNYVTELVYRNRHDEANRIVEKFASIYPDWYSVARGELMSVEGKWANLALGNLDGLLKDPQGASRSPGLPVKFALLGLEQESLTLYETVRSEVFSILGKPGEAVETLDMRFADDPAPWELRELGLILAAAGDYERARPILEELWHRRNGEVVQVGLFEANHAAALIAIRRDAGEEANVGELLAAIRNNVRRYREDGLNGTYWSFGADYEEGLAAYLSGEHERGLALIAEAAENGYFVLPNEAYLQTIYDDPGFTPIMSGQQDRQSRERNRFLNIVCTDNPYAEVWQPAEETCERFAAKSVN